MEELDCIDVFYILEGISNFMRNNKYRGGEAYV
jgi:hypothetical protein